MAFKDVDSFRDFFVNVTHRTGATGDWDDLLVVQALLEIVYTSFTKLKAGIPIKGAISVTGKPAKDTPILIKHYQRVQMKQAKPTGHVNPATGTDKHKETFTIWQLNADASMALAAKSIPDDLITHLTKKHPTLSSQLQSQSTGEVIIKG